MVTYSPAALVATAIVFPLLGLIAVCLRFYCRLHLRRTFLGADDWLVLFAVVVVCAQAIIQILMVEFGVAGQDDTPPSMYDKTRLATHSKLSHAVVVIEKATYTFTKLSVLFLYRRVFGSSKNFKRTAHALIVLVILWGLVFLFLESFICIADAGSTTCTGQEWVLLWFGITDVISDIAILSLPYPMLRRLQVSKSERNGLIAIFALGTISTITGIIRLGYVSKNFYLFFHPSAPSSDGSAPLFWTTAEVAIGVLAACLPPLGPILRQVPAPSTVYSTIRHGLVSSWSRTARKLSTSTGSGSGGSRQQPTYNSNGSNSTDRRPSEKPLPPVPPPGQRPPGHLTLAGAAIGSSGHRTNQSVGSDETLRGDYDDDESTKAWLKKSKRSRTKDDEESLSTSRSRAGEGEKEEQQLTWFKTTTGNDSVMDTKGSR